MWSIKLLVLIGGPALALLAWRRPTARGRLVTLLAALCCGGPALALLAWRHPTAAGAERYASSTAYVAAEEKFAAELTKLADRCRALNDPALADAERITRAWRVVRPVDRQLYYLPRDVEVVRPADDAPLVVRQWHAKFLEIRRKHAEALVELAKRGGEARNGAIRYAWLCEALRNDPANSTALQALDLPPPTHAAKKPAVPSSPRVDHPKTGWRRGAYWRLETDHFQISTNHSPAVALEVGRQLEELHDVWRQLFFSFWSNPEALQARLAGGADRLGPKRQHQVVLFKTRDEYVAKLKPSQPQIELTQGYYVAEQKTVFLYAGDESTRPAWRHEVVHQLLQEALDLPPGVGVRGNMWIVEGVASYMESLRRFDLGYATLGGYDAARLQYARYARLGGSFYMPLAELTALSRESLQKHPEIRPIYTQSTGLAHFLLDGEHGARRDAVLEYLSAVYTQRDAADTLAAKLGESLEEIDRRYPEFLNVTDDLIESQPPPPEIRQLSLGRTSVTARGLAALPALPKLEWLELNLLPVDDDSFAKFQGSTALRQLFLERTRVADESLNHIARFTQLEELDLSGTRITDAGLPRLASLKKLRELYIDDTETTPAALQRLREQLPRLPPP
ncbi:MAG: hypothetical protein U0939_01745 [Pirellulales bacterium]